jgi:hypothetical protein
MDNILNETLNTMSIAMPSQELPTAADLRAAIARANVPLYVLAGRIRLHPTRLSKVVNGHVPIQPELASRIMENLESGTTR